CEDFFINPISIEKLAFIVYFLIKNDIFSNHKLFRDSKIEIFNLGSEENISLYQILKFLQEKYNLKYDIKKQNSLCNDYKFIVDSSKIYDLLKSMNFTYHSTWECIDSFFYQNL
ncbi:MAG: hypothetical protein ACK4ZM_01270, partial [bacterium]